MANKVRIGLLGAGRIGKLHGENLAHAVPNADLYAVADPFMNDATRAWAADMGIEKCYDDPEMIFGDPTRISSSGPPRPASTSSARSRSTPSWQRSRKHSLR